MEDNLSSEEKIYLLGLARESLELGVREVPLPELDINSVPPRLLKPGATFVTLTKNGELRGCIGSLEAIRPLAEDVRLHAVAAALEDYRFPPVHANEMRQILIEISRLTAPRSVKYRDPDELLKLLRPGLDGVVIQRGIQRATFLPQVWEKVPDVEIFLAMLCRKMGMSSNCWRSTDVKISTYRVEKFCE